MPEKRDRTVLARNLILLLGVAMVVASCGGSGSENSSSGTGHVGGTDTQGGSLVDLATFATGAPDHLDPALNNNVEAYSVINALYDGLTDIDSIDPEQATVKPLVAKSYKSSDDARTWTFVLRKGMVFSNGEQVLPSSFVRGWLRASAPDLAGPYANLFDLIEGGKERRAGKVDTLSGVTADDDAMTLTVKLVKPYASFDVIAGFQVFYPMPKAVEDLKDQSAWDRGKMIGNGPFMLEAAPTDRKVVLVRNDRWAGGVSGAKRASLDKITFQVSASVDDAYASFTGGEADTAPIPPSKVAEVTEMYGSTLDTPLLSSYMFQIGWKDPVLGGAANVKLRQAMSQAINRKEINTAVYSGSRTLATGITPPGIPGFRKGLCKYCTYNVEAARAAFQGWEAEGHSLKGPIHLQVNADSGHEPALQIMVDDLKAVGIDAVADTPPQDAYQKLLQGGGCLVCRWNRVADYPTYDNFMFDNFHSSSIGGNNLGGFSDPAFDKLIDQARSTVAVDRRDELFRQAEDVLLNTDVAAIPMFWGRGNYAYRKKTVDHFVQTNFGLVLWEEVTRKG